MKAVVLALSLVACTHGNGPDLSGNTMGPIVLPAPVLQKTCNSDLGCTICNELGRWCVIYVAKDAPLQVVEEEWAHAKGWRH